MNTYNKSSKRDLAIRLMERDYINLSKTNFFRTMTKEQENEWEKNTINAYMRKTTVELQNLIGA